MSALTKIASTDYPHVGRYYQPEDRRMGDVIPFYWNGEHHIFFLDFGRDRFYATPPGARRTPWGHLVSSDLVTWRRLPDAIAPSDGEAVDSGSCATGAVFEHGGKFYLFYTGRHFTRAGAKREVICQAVSDDLITWQKDPTNPIAVPEPSLYGMENFRDPFVYRNEETDEFWMVVTASQPDGYVNRRGCLALLTSKDIKTWEHRGPFWAPQMSFHHECPDVFQFGDWWYLFYSTDGQTRYRMSRSPSGPWRRPPVDTFDDNCFYAAKTGGDATRRVLFGWLSTKVPAQDDGKHEWGGSLACREVRQNPDGTLYADLPPEHRSTQTRGDALKLTPIGGEVEGGGPSRVTLRNETGFAGATFGRLDADAQIRLRIRPEKGTGAFGVFVRTDRAGATGYSLRFEPAQQRLRLGSIDRPGAIRNVVSHSWTLPPAGEVELTITCAGSVIDVLVAGGGALIGRFHDHRGNELGLWTEEGGAVFEDIGVFNPLV